MLLETINLTSYRLKRRTLHKGRFKLADSHFPVYGLNKVQIKNVFDWMLDGTPSFNYVKAILAVPLNCKHATWFEFLLVHLVVRVGCDWSNTLG